jgi:hypothetical protein
MCSEEILSSLYRRWWLALYGVPLVTTSARSYVTGNGVALFSMALLISAVISWCVFIGCLA